ncbi:RING-H2 finger protein ATL57-like [Olea europaea var. sylvestris]|uniref:RING-type E3 ubiquitin transferase n=1 Tax=Olea europaea subsp. europaea TaxID=158383 RepID=A0A8S0UQE6_OLEEU|nr:RING-H2 finger protein ATL57-like [Olea europaea var. sylvestris]XP_022860652.1 RING-H2 finger protein ATL57-like [Olea europaea var. sylvestris]CAA3018549.1 RING-H2 finger ATL57-like [Olea europaea subsp. europaea]
MNSTILNRRLLQVDPYAVGSTYSPNSASRNPNSQSINGTSATINRPFRATTPFDSSMALTVLVLLGALFFMGFFSVYIRRFTAEDPSSSSSSSSSSDVRPSRNPPPEPNHHKGLDPSTMKSLPLVPYGVAVKLQMMIEDCPICLSEFEEREIVKLIPYCRHGFHPRCIDAWLSSHVTCPVCRSTQLFERIEEVCLDVQQEKNNIGVSDGGERLMVINNETCRDEDALPVRLTRTCSCSSLANQAALQRSTSF